MAGTAQRDPDQPPVKLSEDGYGIVAGFETRPTRIEIFTEPQCSHCADLQADFGDQLAYYIGIGAAEGHVPADDVPGPAARAATRRM